MDVSPQAEPDESGFAVCANNRLSGVLGVVSSLLAIAYLARAVEGGGFIDAIATLLFAVIGAHQLWTVFDARIPLLTADESGIRIRLSREWLGLPWSTVEKVIVEHRGGRIRDGRLTIVPRNLGNALEALPPGSRRAVALQRRLHGAPLTVPLSIATRSTGVVRSVEATLASLSHGRAEICALGEGVSTGASEGIKPDRREEVSVETPSPLTPDLHTEPTVAIAYREVVEARREARPVNRVEVVKERSRQIRDAAADALTPIVDQRAVRPVVPTESPARLAVPGVIIGPAITSARERAGLSIDGLAERTSIRPHVLEGIEVDDFSACGGDFYARGHLRTLARFLGLNPAHLVAQYDDLYAHGPISARKVFEAELATSLGTGVRVRSGGPRWSLIAAAVLALLVVWGAARFLAPQSSPVGTASLAGATASPAPSVQTTPITSPLMQESTVVIRSQAWSSQIVVTTVAREGHPSVVVWQGALRSPHSQTLTIAGPFTIQASQATLTSVTINGQPQGKIGTQDGQGSRTFNAQ